VIFSSIALLLLTVTAAEEPPPVVLSMVAVSATNESRESKFYDPSLREVHNTLEDLKFDTFRPLRRETVSIKHNEKHSVTISEEYQLHVTLLSKEKSSGKVRLNVQIEMPPKKKGGKPIKALSTTVVIVPGKQFVLGGLKLKKGNLVIVIALKD